MNSTTFGTIRGQHQPDIQKPAVRVSFVLHPVEHWPHDLVDDSTFDVGGDKRARRKCAHASGVGTSIVIEDPLVVLRRTERDERRAVGEHEIGRFLPDQELLEDDSIAGAAESPLDHQRLNGGGRGGAIVDDHDALAGRKAIGLQHQRISERVALEPRKRRRSPNRRRDSRAVGTLMARHEVLGERLARFERRRGLRRSDDGAAIGREHVDDSPTQRKLGPDDCQIDGLTSGHVQQLARIAHVRIETSGDRRDSGISRSAKDSGDAAFTRELPGHGVLARAAADDEDLHEEQANCLQDRRLTD